MACCGTAQGMSVAQKHSPTPREVKKRKNKHLLIFAVHIRDIRFNAEL
jgi:hypothetical protein